MAAPGLAQAGTQTEIVRPDGDGATEQWRLNTASLNCSGASCFSQVNEVVTQPTAGGTTNFICTPGYATGATGCVGSGTAAGVGTEVQVFDMETLSNVRSVTSVKVWFYAKTVLCVGNGGNCDAVLVSVSKDGTSWETNQSNTMTTSDAWYSATFPVGWTQADLNGLKLRFTWDDLGGGPANNDEVRIYVAYAEVTYKPKPSQLTQRGYIFENDDDCDSGTCANGETASAGVEETTPIAAGNTAITGVKKGERLTLRVHVDNTGTVALFNNTNLALFYDRNDGIWSKVEDAPAVTGAGNCDSDPDWGCEKIVDDTAGVGDQSSLGISQSGIKWIAYQRDTADSCSAAGECSLMMAHHVGLGGTGCGASGSTAWTCETIDDSASSKNHVPDNQSLAIDALGAPWIGYKGGFSLSWDFYVAHHVESGGTGCTNATNSANWVCEGIDVSPSLVVTAGGMGIDLAGVPWASFSTGSLWVARRDGGGTGNCSDTDWNCENVADSGGGNGGDYSSIAIAWDGVPWVSFWSGATNDDLIVARRDGAGAGNCLDADWNCETVDATNSVGKDTSIAFDSSGIPWVAYYDETNTGLRVAHRSTTGFGSACNDADWRCGAVDTTGAVGRRASIAMDPSGNPWVSYFDDDATANNKAVKYARHVGSGGAGCADAAWTGCGKIDSNGADSVGYGTSIAFDTEGNGWISYADQGTEKDLRVARINRGGEIQPSPGLSGDNGNAIAESHADMTTTADTTNRDDTGSSACIAATPGTPVWTNGKWSEAPEITGLSLAAGNTNVQCTELAFMIDTSQAIAGQQYRFAVATDDSFRADKGKWRGPAGISQYPSLTIESSTILRESKDSAPSFSACTGGSGDWGCQLVQASTDTDVQVGWETSLAFDPSGMPWMSYRAFWDKDLWVARYVGSGGSGCTGGSSAWTCTMVEGTESVGWDSSLAFDLSGAPWVSYLENVNTSLRVARYVGSGGSGCTGGSSAWTCTTVDNDADSTGSDSSLAVDPSGTPWVSYRRSYTSFPCDTIGECSLIVAKYVGSGGTGCGAGGSSAWTCTTVDDDTDDTGIQPSLAFDLSGTPWVSYYDATATSLMVAKYVGSGGTGCGAGGSSAWTCTLVQAHSGATESIGVTSSLAIDLSGSPWISYHDFTDGDLWVARYVGSGGNCDTVGGGSSAWTCTLVQVHSGGTENVGNNSSLAFDASGMPWVSHYDSTDLDMWVARYVGSGGNCDTVGGGSDAWDCSLITTDASEFRSLAFDPSGTPWMSFSTPNDQWVAKMHLPPMPLSTDTLTVQNGRNAASGDARYLFDNKGYSDAASDDTSLDPITAGANERPLFTFAARNTNNTAQITPTWVAQSTKAPSTLGADGDLYLEVYRFGTTNAWAQIDTDAACAADTDCTLTASITTNLSEYYEADGANYWVYLRGWQDEDTAAETLRTDDFAVSFTSGVTISGSTNMADGKTVKVAVDGVVQGQTGSTLTSAWSISGVTVNSGQVVTVFVDDGVAETDESTAITKYGGSGNIGGMVLNTHVLSVGSDQNQSITLTDLDLIDSGNDENLMHSVTTGDLQVDGENVYSNETLSILAGDTLTFSGTETMTALDVTVSGALTSTSTGNLTVTDDWTNSGTVTLSAGTVILDGTTDQTVSITGSTTFNNLTFLENSSIANTFTVASGTTLTVNGTLTLDGDSGNFGIDNIDGADATAAIHAKGNVSIADDGWGGSIVITLNGGGAQNVTGNGSFAAAMPSLVIDKANGTATFASTIRATNDWTYSQGSLNMGTSHIIFNGATDGAAILAGTMGFYDVTFEDGRSLATTITVSSGTTLTVSNNLNLTGDGGNFGADDLNGPGSIIVQGNLTSSSDGWTGDIAISLTGGNAQVINAPSTNDFPSGKVTINKTIGTTATLAANFSLDAVGQDLEIQSGTLDLAGFNLVVTDLFDLQANGTLRLQGGEASVSALDTIAAGSTVIYTGSGTYASLKMGNTYHHLTFNNATTGNWTMAAATDVNGNLTIADGAVTAPSSTLNIGGNFTNSDTFTHGSGTVIFDDAAQTSTIAGTGTIFNNLTSTTAGKSLIFTAAQTFQVNGALTITGAAGSLVAINSSDDDGTPTQWNINHQGTESVSYASIKNSGCDVTSTNVTVSGSTSTSLGNNGSCWVFTVAVTANDAPFDNERLGNTTPAFDFTGTDTEGDDLTYQIQIDDTYAFTSAVVDCASDAACTTGNGGFLNTVSSSDANPFTQNQKIRFTPTTVLSNNTTYYWRARAKDPAGSNVFGDWTAIQSFTPVTGTWPSDWFQTTDEQFNTGTLATTETNGSGGVQITPPIPVPTLLTDGSNGTTASATATTASISPTVGKKLLIYVWSEENTHNDGYAYSITPSAGGTPSLVVQTGEFDWAGLTNFTAKGALWELSVTSSASRTYTFDANSGSASTYFYSWVVLQVDDATYAQATVASGAQVGSGGVGSSVASGSLTLGSSATSGNLVIAIAAKSNDTISALSVPTNYTSLVNQTQTWSGVGAFYRTNETGTTVTFSDLGDDVGAWGGVILELVNSGGTSGTIMSPAADYDWLSGATSWNTFNWSENETTGTISVKLYHNSSTDCDTVVPNAALTGNEAGFATGPIDISGLNTTTYNRLCLQATLTNSGGSPILNDWQVSWSATVPQITQRAYRWQSDDETNGAPIDSNTNIAAANTAITGVKKGERLTLRLQIDHDGTDLSPKLGLFYDRNDNIWTKVEDKPLAAAPAGGCGTSGANSLYTCMVVDDDTDRTGEYSSIAFDSIGRAWLAYQDFTASSLMVAQYVGSGGAGCGASGSAAWTCTTVDNAASEGYYNSIAISSSDVPWVSYYDNSNSALRVAQYVGSGGTGCTGGSTAWICTTVDNDTDDTGLWTSLSFDSSNAPWISYRDETATSLMVAQYTGTGSENTCGASGSNNWKCTTVDNGIDDTGEYTSLAFDSAGDPWVSYIDNSNDDLMVARYMGSGGSGCDASGSTAWTCTVVHANGNSTGWFTSLAFGSSGDPWVSFYDATADGLMIARYTGTGAENTCGAGGSTNWQCTTIDDDTYNTGRRTSLAIDPSGNPWISYYQTFTDVGCDTAGECSLKIAQYVGSGGTGCGASGSSAWKCTVVDDDTDDTGEHSSIAFDATGNPWVSYYDATATSLMVAQIPRAGEIQPSPGLAGANGDALNVSVADATPAVADCTEGGSTWVNGKWFESEEASGLTLGDAQCTEVAFMIDTSQAIANQQYRFAVASKDGWRTDKGLWRGPASIAQYPTLTIEASTTERFAKDDSPVFASSGCGASGDPAWGCTTVDNTAASGEYVSLAIDPSGAPWASYYNATASGLVVAHYVGLGGTGCTSSAWTCTTVDNDTDTTGTHTAIAIDPSGTPWVSYRDFSAAATSLMVAKYVGSGGTGCGASGSTAWTCTTVDNDTDNTGWYDSIAIDPSGTPWIAYYDDTATSLMVAQYVGSGGTGCGASGSTAWTCTTVDNDTDITGLFTSIAFDSSGTAWVAYQDNTATSLMVAQYVGSGGTGCGASGSTAWTCTTVDNDTDNTGSFVSLAFDSSGAPWISYRDITAAGLMVAQYTGSGTETTCGTFGSQNWKCTAVYDNANVVGYYTSIAFDSSGTAWVSFYDNTATSLIVARYVGSGGTGCTSSAWTCTTVDNDTDDTGWYTSIAFDPTGTPWVSYRDATATSFMIAKLHLPPGPLSTDTLTVQNGRNAASGDARFLLDNKGYSDSASNDANLDPIIAAAGERPLFTFAARNTNNTAQITPTWVAQSTKAPSTAGADGDLYLEVYRFGTTNAWVSVDSDGVCAAATDCTLTGSITTNLSEYYEADGANYWAYFRGWQDEDTAAETLSSDAFSVSFVTPFSISGTTNLANGKTVKVAYDGVLQPEAPTTLANAWTITPASTPSINQIITVFIDDTATDADESTAITKYSGSGNIAGMVLNTHVLTIGSNQNNSVTLTDLGQYEYDAALRENIMHDVTTGALTVDGENVYTDDALSILAGNTLTFSGTETMTALDVSVAGTLTSTSTGILTVNDDWTVTGSVSHTAGTVLFTTSADSNSTITGSHALNNVTMQNDAATVNTLTLASGTTLTVNGTLTLAAALDGWTNDLNGPGTVHAKGNVTATGAGWRGNAVIEINHASAAQSLTGEADITTYVPSITINKAGGTLSLVSGIAVADDWIWTQGTVAAGASTVIFTAIHDLGATITGTHALNNVIFQNAEATVNTVDVASGTTLTVNGTLTLASPTAGWVNNLNGPGAVHAKGNVVATGAGWRGNAVIEINHASAAQSLTGEADTTTYVPAININKAGGTLSLVSGIAVADDWIWTQGTVSAGTSTVIFTSVQDQAATITGTHSLANVTFENSAATVNNVNVAAGTTLTVTGTLTLSAPTPGWAKNLNGTGSISVQGDLTSTGDGWGGNITLSLTGGNAQNINVPTTDLFPSGTFTVNKTGGTTATLAAAFSPNTVGQDLVIQSGTLDLAGFGLTVGQTLDLQAAGTLQLQGGETVSPAPTAASGSIVIYNGTGNYSASNLAAGNTYHHLTFDDGGVATGQWLIGAATTVGGDLIVTSGTVTQGDGTGDNVQVGGLMSVGASGAAGDAAVYQTKQDLAQGSTVTLHINNPTPVSCATCKILVGAASGSTGKLDIGKNTVVQLNAFNGASAGDSDVGIEVESTGYLEVQGTQDVAAAATDLDTAALRSTTICTATDLTADHTGKVVRITNTDSLAFGRIYAITATAQSGDTNCATDTHDSIAIGNESSTDTTTAITITGTGPTRTVDGLVTGTIAANDEGIGRYLRNLTEAGGEYYKIVDSTDGGAGTDSVIIIAEPDAFTNLDTNDDVDISDGIRPATDSFEILDYAHVTAEAGTACNADNAGNGEAYILAKAGSETTIRYAELCDLGRNAADLYGLTANGVNGANASESLTVEKSRVHSGYRGIFLTGTSNHGGSTGILSNRVFNNANYEIYLTSTANTTLSGNRSEGNSSSAIAALFLENSTGNVVSSNRVSHPGFYAIWLATSSGNALAGNHGYGGQFHGILLTSSANNNVLAGNVTYATGDDGLRLNTNSSGNIVIGSQSYVNIDSGLNVRNAADNNVLAGNVSYGNAVGLREESGATTTIAINEAYGVAGDNTTSDVEITGTGNVLRIYNSTLGSSTAEVTGASGAGTYLTSFKHDAAAGATRIWGEYTIPDNNTETPQNEHIQQFNYANALWSASATAHGYSGTGTEDADFNYDLSTAVLSGGPYVYRAVCADDATNDCDSAVAGGWNVYRYNTAGTETLVGTASKTAQFTDSNGGVNVKFTIDGGLAGTAYTTGDTYTFVVWDSSGDANTQKSLTMMQDGDKLTVGSGETLELKGQSAGTNVTTVTRGATGGYQVTVQSGGAIDANAYKFDYLGGTGQAYGLDLQTGAIVTSLDNGAFDNYGMGTVGTESYIRVDDALVATGSPSRTFTGLSFGNTGAVLNTAHPDCNINTVNDDAAAGYWEFHDSTGVFATEGDDCDQGAEDPDPGEFDWVAATHVSGTTNLADGKTVKVAINGVLDSATTTTGSGVWLLEVTSTINTNDIVTVFIDDGATDADESTAITKYDGAGDITGMVLNAHVLTIGSADNASLAHADLALYDYNAGGNENVMHDVTGTFTLTVDAEGVYADEGLRVLSGNTFTQGDGYLVNAHNVVIDGTYTAAGTGSFNVSGSWDNNGIYNSGTQSVSFTSTSPETIDSTGAAVSNFYILVLNGVGGQWTLNSPLVVTDNLNPQNGTLTGAQDVTVNGQVMGNIGESTINMTGGTFEMRISNNESFGHTTGTANWTFNNLTFSNSAAANYSVTTTSNTAGDIIVTGVLTIGRAGDTNLTSMNMGAKTWRLTNPNSATPLMTEAGKGWINQPGTSTVVYSGDNDAGNVTIRLQQVGYYNLTLGGAVAETYAVQYPTSIITIASNDLTIGANATLSTTNQTTQIGGSYTNNGIFTHNGGTVEFNATAGGKTLSGNMTSATSSAFNKVLFNGNGGGWTIQDPMTVVADATDTFEVRDGTVTIGNGPNDDLEVRGRIAIGTTTTAGDDGILQTHAGLTEGQNIDIHVNQPVPVSCTNCGIVIGAASGSTGQLTISKNVILQLNAFNGAVAGDSDVGITVESTGTLLISGSVDDVYEDTGTAGIDSVVHDAGATITINDANQGWTVNRHANKHVRISNASSLAFGKIYQISSNAANALTFTDSFDTEDTTASVSGTGPTYDITAGLITATDDHIGRYVYNMTDNQHYKIVDSLEGGANDTITVIGEPDTVPGSLAGKTVKIAEGIRAGDQFIIYDYAHVTAENGTACGATINQNGEAYILGKAGSDIEILFAGICNLGRNAADRYGIVANTVDGSIANQGLSVGHSRVHKGYRGVSMTSSTNNNAVSGEGSGVRDNEIYGHADADVFLSASSYNVIDRNMMHESAGLGDVYGEAGSDWNTISGNVMWHSVSQNKWGILFALGSNNTVNGNVFYGSGEGGFWFFGESHNNLLMSNVVSSVNNSAIAFLSPAADNLAIGNTAYTISGGYNGIRVDDGSALLMSNTVYDATGPGMVVIGNSNVLAGNQSYSNNYGLEFNGSNNLVISDNYGSSFANTTADINGAAAGAAGIALYNTTLAAMNPEAVNVTATGEYIVSFGHDGSLWQSRIWGQYTIPDDNLETPQNEGLNQFNYANELWPVSASAHNYYGTGTEDTNLNYDLDTAVLSSGPYAYRVVCANDAVNDCDSAVAGGWNVYRYNSAGTETLVGTASKTAQFTDSNASVNVKFTIDGGLAGTAYATGDTYTFAVWNSGGGTNGAKSIVVWDDGSRITVGSGETLELKGQSAGVNVTSVTRAWLSGGYQVVVQSGGAIDANAYKFDFLGGTGQAYGLDLQSGAIVTSLDSGAFDNFAVSEGTADAFIRVDQSLIGAGAPSKTFSGLSFVNTGSTAECNLNGIGIVDGYWQLTNATGTFAGEDNDCDDGAADADPGHFKWGGKIRGPSGGVGYPAIY